MNPSATQRVVKEWHERVIALESEIARLKGLVKEAEWTRYGATHNCTWCCHPHHTGRHEQNCPAFTVEGEVK